MLQQSQRIFEEGECGGRLLAWLVREHGTSSSTSVPSLVDKDGCFASYYSELYSTRVDYSTEDLHIYLSDVDFPDLTSTYRDRLDSPIPLRRFGRACLLYKLGRHRALMDSPLYFIPHVLRIWHPGFTLCSCLPCGTGPCHTPCLRL